MAPPQPLPSLPDEILEDIFLRLDALEDLARTSAACTTFRRVVSARRFLRRFHSLHAAPVLGLVGFGRLFHPAEPPHRSATAARALEQAADFTFSFLPDPNPGSWRVCDARDGRVLLYKISTVLCSELVVCDPLYRRYVQIPSIPEDLLSSAPRSGSTMHQTFLAPVGDDDEASSIRLIHTVLSESKAVPFVFSSVTGEWCSGPPFNHGWFLNPLGLCRFYARGCFYWASLQIHHRRNSFLMLDPREMIFSDIASPVHHAQPRAFVDEGEDKLGLLTFGRGNRTLELYCKNWRNNAVGAGEWRHEKSIPLPQAYIFHHIVGSAQGCLLLQQLSSNQCFVLNLKTLLVERLCTLDKFAHGVLYAGFPPPLSLPSI